MTLSDGLNRVCYTMWFKTYMKEHMTQLNGQGQGGIDLIFPLLLLPRIVTWNLYILYNEMYGA